jgi:hypothetical protein
MATDTLTLSLDSSALMDFLSSAEKLLETASVDKASAFANDIGVLVSCGDVADIQTISKGLLKAIPTPAAIECLRKHGGY